MENNYKYIIYSPTTIPHHIADYDHDHIIYKDEKYYSHTGFMRAFFGYTSNQSNFLIRCIGPDDSVVFTTSYKKLERNLSSSAGKDRIKEMYKMLERKKRGDYVAEAEDPLIDHVQEDDDELDDKSSDDLEPNDILNSIKFTMKMVSKYMEQLDSSSETQKYSTIYEQLNTIKKNI